MLTKLLRWRAEKTALKFGAWAVAAVIRGVGWLERRMGVQLLAAYPRSRYGVRLKANWNDRTFRYCLFGTYGDALSTLLRDEAEPFVFLDIGANQGLYSLIAATNPKCRKAIALEPVKSTFALL